MKNWPEDKRELIAAYEETIYSVDTPFGSISFKINENNEELNDFLRRNDASEWAFITAFNPRSKQLSPKENEKRNARLQSILEERDLKFLLGNGGEGDQDWPPEVSFFILDISSEDATKLAKTFDQNAIVWSKVENPPDLIWCAT